MCIIDSTVIGDADSYKLIKELLYKEYTLLSVSEVAIEGIHKYIMFETNEVCVECNSHGISYWDPEVVTKQPILLLKYNILIVIIY